MSVRPNLQKVASRRAALRRTAQLGLGLGLVAALPVAQSGGSAILYARESELPDDLTLGLDEPEAMVDEFEAYEEIANTSEIGDEGGMFELIDEPTGDDPSAGLDDPSADDSLDETSEDVTDEGVADALEDTSEGEPSDEELGDEL